MTERDATGLRTWPGSLILSAWLVLLADHVGHIPLDLLELGCGCALPSLFASSQKLFRSSTCTDCCNDSLKLVDASIALNSLTSISTQNLLWNYQSPIFSQSNQFVLIAADIIYPDTDRLALKSLFEICSHHLDISTIEQVCESTQYLYLQRNVDEFISFFRRTFLCTYLVRAESTLDVMLELATELDLCMLAIPCDCVLSTNFSFPLDIESLSPLQQRTIELCKALQLESSRRTICEIGNDGHSLSMHHLSPLLQHQMPSTVTVGDIAYFLCICRIDSASVSRSLTQQSIDLMRCSFQLRRNLLESAQQSDTEFFFPESDD